MILLYVPLLVQLTYAPTFKSRNYGRTSRLVTFPDYLVLHMRKFLLDAGWVPRKLGRYSIFIFASLKPW